MKEFKGTKGDWKAKGLIVLTDENKTICNCCLMTFLHDRRGQIVKDTQGEANAQLISASPELLEACMECIDPLTGLVYDGITKFIGNSAAYKIEQSIKKALGND